MGRAGSGSMGPGPRACLHPEPPLTHPHTLHIHRPHDGEGTPVIHADQVRAQAAGDLAPVVEAMIAKGLAGGDPRDVLRDGKVVDILPPQSETEKAMLATRAGKA